MRARRALVALGVLWITATFSSAQEPLSFERYRNEIEPIFLAPRGGHGPGMSPCVTCHARNGTPLKLESLQENDDGSVFWTEEQSRRNSKSCHASLCLGTQRRAGFCGRRSRSPRAERAFMLVAASSNLETIRIGKKWRRGSETRARRTARPNPCRLSTSISSRAACSRSF